MAAFVFNVAKGRIGEYVNRVINNDPAPSAIIWVPLSQSGTEAQGQDLATLAAVEADANFAERTTGGWARITHDDVGDGLAWTVDNTGNRSWADANDLSFGSPAAANNTTGLLACYDADTGAGTDANIIPLVHLDMAVTTDGNAITYVFNASNGWFQAT